MQKSYCTVQCIYRLVSFITVVLKVLSTVHQECFPPCNQHFCLWSIMQLLVAGQHTALVHCACNGAVIYWAGIGLLGVFD